MILFTILIIITLIMTLIFLWVSYSKLFIYKTKQLKEKLIEVEKLKNTFALRLENIAKLSQQEAKDLLLKQTIKKNKEKFKLITKDLEKEILEKKYELSKDILLNIMEKNISSVIQHATTYDVKLKNENLRGKIIGKNGRNLRSIEEITGADIVLNNVDNIVQISCFNPIRREIALRTIKALIADGRIHPGTIEDTIIKQKEEFQKNLKKIGEEIIERFNIKNIAPEIIEKLGVLNYRYSYGQNVLQHSIETAQIAKGIASKLNLDTKLAFRAGLLHDIGKAIDIEVEGTHANLGAKFIKKFNENPIIINSVESHHDDVPATSAIAQIVKIADSCSASRPGARANNIEKYIDRVKDIENIANEINSVKDAFAIRGGKELRVFIKPKLSYVVDSSEIASEIKEKIESQIKFPGIIKITIIKENRFTTTAIQPKK